MHARPRHARPRHASLALPLVLLLLLGVRPASAAEDPVRLMAFGDSLIHGYGLPAGETFPDQLEAALRDEGHGVEVINAGSSGDTSAAGRARLVWNLSEEPDAVILLLGANDGLRGLEPAETRRNLEAMLATLAAEEIPVLLAGMLAPPNLGAEYGTEFKAVYRELAEAHDVVFYPFFLEGVAAEPALNQDDGMHPNAAGVATIVDSILPKVHELLERVRAGPAGDDG
ncbi:MAG: arylesterase [Tistlia sp.]